MVFLGFNPALTVSTIDAFGLIKFYVPDGVSTIHLSGFAQKVSGSATTLTVRLRTRPADSADSPAIVDSFVFDLTTAFGSNTYAPLTGTLTAPAPGMYDVSMLVNAVITSINGYAVHGE